MKIFFVQFFCVFLPPLLSIFCFCQVRTISVLYRAHLCMKCSLGISNFLEEISSLSHSVVFLYFFALIAEEGFLISSCYSPTSGWSAPSASRYSAIARATRRTFAKVKFSAMISRQPDVPNRIGFIGSPPLRYSSCNHRGVFDTGPRGLPPVQGCRLQRGYGTMAGPDQIGRASCRE